MLKSYPSDCFSYIPNIRTIVLSLPLQKPGPWNKWHLAAQEICMLVVGKDASTLTTLHGIVNSAKNGATRKILSSNRYQRLAAVSPINTFGQIWEFCSQHFRNENLTLEINGGHFVVLHWQQWKLPASTCDKIISAHIYRHIKRIASQQQVNCSQDIVAETCNLSLF